MLAKKSKHHIPVEDRRRQQWQQLLYFASKVKARPLPRVVQGLNRKPIPAQDNASPREVYDRKRPHAIEFREPIDTVSRVRTKNYLPICVRPKGISQLFQLFTQLDEIKDLPVENKPQALPICHRLSTCIG